MTVDQITTQVGKDWSPNRFGGADWPPHGSVTLRLCYEQDQFELYAFAENEMLAWQASFSSSTPVPVIVATIKASLSNSAVA